MKKALILMMALIMVLGFTGCSSNRIEGKWWWFNTEYCNDGFITYDSFLRGATISNINAASVEDSECVFDFRSDGYIYCNMTFGEVVPYYKDQAYSKHKNGFFYSKSTDSDSTETWILDGDYLYIVSYVEDDNYKNIKDIREMKNYCIHILKRVY